jgi:hypothetical protein
MNTTGTSVIQEQQELDGLISQARIQYGKVCANQHELGITLLKLRDATKAQGNRAGKGFEACLAEIGISKTQAYRFIHAAETGHPVDYDNAPTSSRNGTTLPPNATAEQIEAASLEWIVKNTWQQYGQLTGRPRFREAYNELANPPKKSPSEPEEPVPFHYEGNKADGNHYILTPKAMREEIQQRYPGIVDICPYPRPKGYNALTEPWHKMNYANIPFGTTIDPITGKKEGPTAWARKGIEEQAKGNSTLYVFPVDYFFYLLIKAGAVITPRGPVSWVAIEDGSSQPSGRNIVDIFLPGKEGA